MFQDSKLQPNTIDGYMSADKLGNSTINVSKDESLTGLLDNFHRDRPKGRRGTLSWNLSLVLHQLTKAPFGQIKKGRRGGLLEHLSFKTVFLLAKQEHQTPVRMVKGVSVPISLLSFKESASRGGSRQCGPSGYTSPGPNSG